MPSPPLSRRDILQAAVAGVASLAPPLSAAPTASRIRSCILVFFYGGPSHLDTFDPKPDAPAEVRGEFRTLATAVPGLRFGEHLPRLARLAGRLALARAVHHPMRNHNSAAAEALTGKTPAGGDQELLTDDPLGMPTLGSAVAFALGRRAHVLPYVALPYTMYNVVQLPGQTPGLLGGAYDRFQVDRDPSTPDFAIPALGDAGSLAGRQALLGSLDRAGLPGRAGRSAAYRDRAFRLLASDDLRRSFDLAKEPAQLRERYGRTRLGQSLLLARRLVEGGVNFVSVFDGHANGQDVNWDSHERLFTRHRQLIPPADVGLSALIEDLAQRGLLDSTLVLAMGEFGRTPKVNRSAGRDHWPDCYTALLAGGGVRGGAVYGASDRIGAYPAANGVSPADVAATVFWRFGLDPASVLRDQTGRPFTLSEGQPIRRLFA
ncbi:MAG: DUF1501 domain-containing protein [Gemmataceae bacterium]